MKLAGWVLVVAVLDSTALVAQPTPAVRVSSPIDGIRAGRQRFNAAAAKGDKQAYAAVLSDDLTWVDRGGRLRNKAAEVAELTPREPTRNEPDVYVYGDSAVLVSRRPTDDEKRAVVAMQVWHRVGNDWVLLAIQNSQIGGNPTGTDTRPSSSLPPSSGPAADRRAVEALSQEIARGNLVNDAAPFIGLTTDQFVSVTATGSVRNKTELAALRAPGRNADAETVVEQSVRIHGNVAVMNSTLKSSTGTLSRRLEVGVKQNDQWLAAGVITTAVLAK